MLNSAPHKAKTYLAHHHVESILVAYLGDSTIEHIIFLPEENKYTVVYYIPLSTLVVVLQRIGGEQVEGSAVSSKTSV